MYVIKSKNFLNYNNMYKYLYIIILIIIVYVYYLYENHNQNYENNNKIHSIVFFHNHSNGDSHVSRLLVKQIMDSVKDVTYYYTAPNTLESSCRDLGILDKNVNVINIPEEFSFNNDIYNNNNLTFFTDKDGYLYINVWFGNSGLKYEPTIFSCWVCLTKVRKFYNHLINLINDSYNFNIAPIILDDPYVQFDYYYYDCYFLSKYIDSVRNKYKKIILYYNLSVRTLLNLNNIDHDLIISNMYNNDPNALYITFIKSKIEHKNIISVADIYHIYNKEIPKGIGIQIGYLSSFCDKIITTASGAFPLILTDKNKNVKNKILLINDKKEQNFFNDLNHDSPNENLSCLAKYNWFITTYIYNNDNNELSKNIITFINN